MADTGAAKTKDNEQKQGSPQVTRDSSKPLSDQSKQLSNTRIEREISQTMRQPTAQPVQEALEAAQETRKAFDAILKGNSADAKSAMERALGKLDMVLSTHPNVALIPMSVDRRIIDIYADELTLRRITSNVAAAVEDGLYQQARRQLLAFASELDVITVNLPLATYPDAIRAASRSLEQGNTNEATAALAAALQSLVVLEQPIPLPILRAQAFIDEVSRQVNENKVDKDTANRLLNDADQQLRFAEDLGYGQRDVDFKDLSKAIDEIRESINKDKDSRGLLDRLKEKLRSFKEDASRPSEAA